MAPITARRTGRPTPPIRARFSLPPPWRGRLVSDPALLVIVVAVLGGIAVLLGADGNGDLRNYHLYGGWALLHKRVGFDVAPAQLQTYHYPLLDALFVLLAKSLNPAPRLFTFLWAIPQAVAVWIAYLVARRCLGPAAPRRFALFALLIGAGGATSLGTIGTSLSEGIPNALMMTAIWLVLRADLRGRAVGGYALAGALAGAGTVLKLTAAPYLVGFGGATLVAFALEPRWWRVRAALAFGVAALLAIAAIGGPWWLAVYRAFGNPLFPYYNAIFRSPLYLDQNFFDLRFLPRTPWEWLTYPWEWAFRKTTRPTEQIVRDPRVLLAVLASIALLAAGVWRRAASPACWCAAYTLCSYVVWLKMFSILRYASGLETLSGALIVSAVALLPVGRTALAAAVTVLTLALTVVPTWERRPHPGKRLFAVTMAPLPADSTVLIFGIWEKAFLATTQPASIRWIGLQNNLVWFDRPIGLDRVIEQDVAAATGPLWSITDRPEPTDDERRWFARLHLRQGTPCAPIVSTISPPYTICPLQRMPSAG